MGKLLREVPKITMEIEALSPNPNVKSDDDAEETFREKLKILEITFLCQLSFNS